MKPGRLQTGRNSGEVQRQNAAAIFVLLALTLVMFADVLFTRRDAVMAFHEQTDFINQFADWRNFGFGEMRRGNLALWNPYLFTGIPFLGDFQSALLYPPNLVYLALPVTQATNIVIALHVFLLGAFMFLWLRHRGLSASAGVMGAGLVMFCGAYFPHIPSGHLSNVCAMVWAPLIFLAIDGLLEKPSLGWCLLGMFATAMQVYAGHPQYVFYTAVAAAVYVTLRLARRLKTIPSVAPWLAAMAAGGFGLASVQILAGFDAAAEFVRAAGVPYSYAASFSFPPINLLTLAVPTFFGDPAHVPYWGQWQFREMALFVGITGVALAVYAVVFGEPRLRRFSTAMCGILMVLAFGTYTPLFRVLYSYVPYFDSFRANSRFTFPATLFLAMLAGIGLDSWVQRRRGTAGMAAVLGCCALMLGAAALWVGTSAPLPPSETVGPPTPGFWTKALQLVVHNRVGPEARRFAGLSLAVAAAVCLILPPLLLLSKRVPKARYAIVALAIAEVFVFARFVSPVYDLELARIPELEWFHNKHAGDFRVLQFVRPNNAMSWQCHNLWGHDTGLSLRYAQFLAFSQGVAPDTVSELLWRNFRRHDDQLFSMLRSAYVIGTPEMVWSTNQNPVPVRHVPGAMPRVSLLYDHRVIPERDAMFAAMQAPDFDPRKTVLLEDEPEPAPVPSQQQGTVTVLDTSTDHLTVACRLPSPAILLITDGYRNGWRATPIGEAPQPRYTVMPANYVLRAIPLAAGRHRIRVEYAPLGFRVGVWTSTASWVAFLAALAWHAWNTKKRSRALSASADTRRLQPQKD
ncbi:MAG TPA: hypothetical protein HPP77_04605 [Candidatus Hydrogenedentes bacterium]|nr:hypothetical protein [Candidatus Hydrogenedentota bacterium]